MNIKTVTIVGANGTMGSNVGGIFASFGNAKVYMVSRDIEKSKNAVVKAVKSVRADSISRNLIPVDYSMLNRCVAESDLVFESVSESFQLKSSVARQISEHLKDDAIVCSGTSGLSVTALAEMLPDNFRNNYLGIHFFNPPYNMTLCEVIPTERTNRALLKELKTYLSDVLFRTVVESKDSPAFIGNRIGFHFINKALQFAERYKRSGGIDYIDTILGTFTGRSMPPLATSDFVGLDICKAIVDNIHEKTDDYAHAIFTFPTFAKELINNGFLGRKSGGGLYKMESKGDGTKRLMVYDIDRLEYREKLNYVFPFAEEMIALFKVSDYQLAFKKLIYNKSIEANICVEFLLEYVIYSLFVSTNVGNRFSVADDVMATGFNWCPPIALFDIFSAVTDFKSLISERIPTVSAQADVGSLLDSMERSRYDYRPYFKAKK